MKITMFFSPHSAPGIFRCLFGFSMLILFTFSLPGQEIKNSRKEAYRIKKGLKKEIDRTKRDFETIRSLSSSKRTIDASTDTADVITWSMKPYIPNSGMIHDYEYVYTFLHARQEYTFQRDEDMKSIQWDSVTNVFYKNTGKRHTLRDGAEVIGWHPYWMGEAYKHYNYNLLSMISYYSYDIDPNTGSYWNTEIIDQLRNSSLPDSAAKYGTQTLISVTSLTKENNSLFLTNETAQERFIREILELLGEKEGKFAGIDLNFEEIDPTNRDDFTRFVQKLNARLTTSGYLLILDVPYFNDGNVLDYEALKDHVKYFNIMGYDFSGEHSGYPGSISPLHTLSTQPSLETAVNDFFNLGISGQQLILSLPLYGVTWDITSLEKGGAPRYEQSLPYYKIIADYETAYNPYYDPFSASFFFVVEEKGRRKMCWYENEISLDTKFQWAERKDLKGIGLWALGYAQGASEIWETVADNFGADSLVAITPVSSRLSGPYGIVKEIVAYKKMIGLFFLIFAGFIMLGFVVSLKDWRVREVLFQKQSFRVVYSLAFLTLSVFGIRWWWLYGPGWDPMISGLLIGGLGVLLINLAFTRHRKFLK